MFQTPELLAKNQHIEEKSKADSARKQAYADATQWTIITSSSPNQVGKMCCPLSVLLLKSFNFFLKLFWFENAAGGKNYVN